MRERERKEESVSNSKPVLFNISPFSCIFFENVLKAREMLKMLKFFVLLTKKCSTPGEC